MDQIIATTLSLTVIVTFLLRTIYCIIQYALAKEYRKGSLFEFTHETYLTHCIGCNYLEYVALDALLMSILFGILYGLYDMGLVASVILIGTVSTIAALCVAVHKSREKHKRLKGN